MNPDENTAQAMRDVQDKQKEARDAKDTESKARVQTKLMSKLAPKTRVDYINRIDKYKAWLLARDPNTNQILKYNEIDIVPRLFKVHALGKKVPEKHGWLNFKQLSSKQPFLRNCLKNVNCHSFLSPNFRSTCMSASNISLKLSSNATPSIEP